MGTSKRYSAEVRERALRMVAEHLHEYSSQWAAIVSIAGDWPRPSPDFRDGPLCGVTMIRIARETVAMRCLDTRTNEPFVLTSIRV